MMTCAKQVSVQCHLVNLTCPGVSHWDATNFPFAHPFPFHIFHLVLASAGPTGDVDIALSLQPTIDVGSGTIQASGSVMFNGS